MAQKLSMLALGLIAAAAPAAAQAPPGTPQTRYCMRIEASTGTRIEMVECWTRDEWAWQGVDVDKHWPKEGVAVEG